MLVEECTSRVRNGQTVLHMQKQKCESTFWLYKAHPLAAGSKSEIKTKGWGGIFSFRIIQKANISVANIFFKSLA